MRVLLVPPKNNYPYPGPQSDFGIGQGMPYLAGALKAAGHEVFGANIYHLWCHGSAPLTLERGLREAIEKHQPQLIGIGGLAGDYYFVRDAIFFCRKIAPNTPIVLGGGIITYDPDFIFSHFKPEFAVIGEGEISLVKLAEYLDNGGELHSIPSLAYWKDSQPVFNKIQYPNNLDELPLPDYDPFDYGTYLSLYDQLNSSLTYSRLRPRVFPIAIGRSCPYRCTFCSKSSDYRTRSIDSAIKEIAYFYEKYRFNILYITDDLFSVKGGKALEFCTKVKALREELKADFDWICCLRVNDVNIDMLREMKESGCISIFYGFESASNIVLKSMRKGTKVEQMLRAIQLTEEAGIGIRSNFIFGDIAETPESIKETIDFYNKYCKDHCVDFVYITPYPGSKLHQYCLDKSIITDKQHFYETTAYEKSTINLTTMSDDVFYKLTKSLMPNAFDCKTASVLSCEKKTSEGCDRNIPFELRRSFYEINAICPHCQNEVSYLYPIKIAPDKFIKPRIQQFCVKCHKRILLDISERATCNKEEDPYSRFYQHGPYVNYYPFDSAKFIMQSAPAPYLLESYKQFNIVHYANYIFGIAQALGPLDIVQLTEDQIKEYQKIEMWFTGASNDEVKNLIDKKLEHFKIG